MADSHLMNTWQAAEYLHISEGAVLVAVHRKKLHPEGKDYQRKYVFAKDQLDKYDETRRKRSVAQSERLAVRSNRP